ncbi:hypothetical protein RhiirA5_401259 [Rhizophagus irregularis]|uniref:Uncharacterized protein n=1 Tax=Rhizophagus irregularis TaxID=588596 RepID=A0A2I1ENQ9_9GLOM|nr:hypothetical protein RhiirA5_401259 [Rhizophagus irregularis]PKY23753.1 hypothetical protein RhiirB3_526741 [Rhizophagus irregularis]CAB4475439.1 unnamed protein product [Rhizophagus irregularis]CAB5215601.1 unnamed protein product [Rhizophagus irregularis]CAB5373867.1 unnamed protein product [Rhizophagus irregularis]
MRCKVCRIDKLSHEFPADTISQRCNHVSNFCLRCLIKKIDVQQSNQKCPECDATLTRQEVKDLYLAWEKSPFRVVIENVLELKLKNENNLNSNAKGDFYVILLNGTKLNFKLENIKTVEALKEAIKQQTNIENGKQKLIHKGVELEIFSNTTRIKKQLSEYSIVDGSHIQLMVLLYSISKELSINALTFDLYWGFPPNRGDFLDGTCLLFAGKHHYRTFDYRLNHFSEIPDMSHSGDIIDKVNRRGHHSITANLATIPRIVTKLYFVLSAYRSPNIGCFTSPSFKLFDPSYPDTQLCSYTIQSASTSKAVIMCVIEKSDEGNWNIFEIGKLCDGNVLDYTPILNTISELDVF